MLFGGARREHGVEFVVSRGSFNDGGEHSEDRRVGQIDGQRVTTRCKCLADGGHVYNVGSVVGPVIGFLGKAGDGISNKGSGG